MSGTETEDKSNGLPYNILYFRLNGLNSFKKKNRVLKMDEITYKLYINPGELSLARDRVM